MPQKNLPMGSSRTWTTRSPNPPHLPSSLCRPPSCTSTAPRTTIRCQSCPQKMMTPTCPPTLRSRPSPCTAASQAPMAPLCGREPPATRSAATAASTLQMHGASGEGHANLIRAPGGGGVLRLTLPCLAPLTPTTSSGRRPRRQAVGLHGGSLLLCAGAGAVPQHCHHQPTPSPLPGNGGAAALRLTPAVPHDAVRRQQLLRRRQNGSHESRARTCRAGSGTEPAAACLTRCPVTHGHPQICGESYDHSRRRRWAPYGVSRVRTWWYWPTLCENRRGLRASGG